MTPRPARRAFAARLAACALLACALAPLAADAGRMFPQRAQRGEITFVSQREVVLNGQTERLAPGAVVRNERNTIALSGSLRGKTFTVNYLRDPAGMVREIWLLSDAEIGVRPKSTYRHPKDMPKPGPVDPTLYLN